MNDSVIWRDLYNYLELTSPYESFFDNVVGVFCKSSEERSVRTSALIPSCGSSGLTLVCSIALQELKRGFLALERHSSISAVALTKDEELKWPTNKQKRFVFKYARWEQNRSAQKCSNYLRTQGFETPDITYGSLNAAKAFAKIAVKAKSGFTFDPTNQTFIGMIAFEGSTLDSLIKNGDIDLMDRESRSQMFRWFGGVVFYDLLIVNTDRLFRVEGCFKQYAPINRAPNTGNLFIMMSDGFSKKNAFVKGLLIDNESSVDLFKTRRFIKDDFDVNTNIFNDEQDKQVVLTSSSSQKDQANQELDYIVKFDKMSERFIQYLKSPNELLDMAFNEIVNEMKLDHQDNEYLREVFKTGFFEKKGLFPITNNKSHQDCFNSEANEKDPDVDYFSEKIKAHIEKIWEEASFERAE